MNEKKKLLSLFLCLALLFSMLSTTLVSADGWNPTTVAEVTGENTVTIQATRKGVYVKFTPTESGEYIIYSKSDYDPYAYLYDSDNNQLCYNDDYYYGDYENGNDFCMYVELEAGKEYFVQVKIYRKQTFDVVFEKAADDYVYQRTFSKGDFQYQILEDGTYEIQGFANNYQTPTDLENFSIEIPSEVKGKPVTKIASYAFNCCDIKNVTIPDSVTIIDEGAFEDCYNLKSVTIPDSVTSIGYYAFGWCYSLTSVSIPKNVSNIGEGAFKYCYSLTSINVDSQNKDYSSVEGVLFNKDKTELLQYPAKKANESYSIPGSVTSISDDAFRSCSSLTSVTIPDSVTSIGSYAFDDCEKLSKITIGNGVTSIGVNAFNYTAYYNNEANWEKDVLYIGKYLVVAKSCSWTGHWDENNGWVEEYIPGISGDCTIKDGTKLIADSAFSDRYELTGITIPNSVVIIGNRAFNGCEKLSKITIGSGVTSIGASAFHYTAYYNDNSKWENGVLYIGKYLLDARDDYYDGYWDENDNWIEGDHIPGIPEDYTIKSGTTLIADYAFEGCYDLSKVTIPGSIMFFGDDAFSYCSNLSKVTILEGVKSIGNYAFYDCYNLSKVTIAEGVKTIGDYAFYNCGSLNVVKIPVSVTEFGEKALGYNSYYSEEEDISTDKASENFIIMGYNDTMAESYAKENGFEFILIGCLHKEVIDNAVAATCTGIGLTEGKYCSVCNKILVKQEVVKALGHTEGEWEILKQATESEEGKRVNKCSVCKEIIKVEAIAKLEPTVKPDKPTEPQVCLHNTVIKNLKKATYFAKGYTGDTVCLKCGEVTLKGKATDKLTLKVPKFKLTKGKKLFKVKYTKIADATGFQVRYKVKGKWKIKTFKATKTVTKTIKKLKKGTYQVQIRAMIVSGNKKAYSTWSKTQNVKVK